MSENSTTIINPAEELRKLSDEIKIALVGVEALKNEISLTIVGQHTLSNRLLIPNVRSSCSPLDWIVL